ncbi:hypothetical protein [Acanthopleuribacter pedis]|uniref:HPr kinase n=1 Tax=Acanthopleuribacter pedis TaxID=442870 RepID=A0A8J7QGN0_9BACT|nr:hypothetical protein [Acanthopleuribacter pedis]MBO1318220.1 hypothetical protein [Acanthopleuribacter pedis]
MNVLNLHLLEKKVRLETDWAEAFEAMTQIFEASLPDAVPAAADLTVTVAKQQDGRGRTWFQTHCQPANALQGMETEEPLSPLSLARNLCSWAAQQTRETYVYHGAALAQDDRGVLLLGDSGSGKTTLALEMARRGWAFYSDEVVALALENRAMTAFPRRPVLRRDVWSLFDPGPFPSLPLEPAALPNEQPAAPLRLAAVGAVRPSQVAYPAAVVFPRFEAGAAPRRERLDQGSMLLAMMGASCSQPIFKVRGLDFVIDIVRQLPGYLLTYGRGGDAAAEISSIVSER